MAQIADLQAVWRASPGLKWVQWGEYCVIYNGNSGDTHLIEGIPSRLFDRCLSGEPFDGEVLFRFLESGETNGVFSVENILEILIRKELIDCYPA